jgi:hypothetical protein
MSAMLEGHAAGEVSKGVRDRPASVRGSSPQRGAPETVHGIEVDGDSPYAELAAYEGARPDRPARCWYKRNFVICANLLQLSQPGDRAVVFYGSGHAFLLRKCVVETPGFDLIEPNDSLPK